MQKAYLVLFAIFLAVSVTARAQNPVAEISVSEAFLKQFQFTGQKTQAFYNREGKLVHPNIRITIDPKLNEGDKQASFLLDVNVNGTSLVNESKAVGPLRRRTVNVSVVGNINANYAQEVFLGEAGLERGGMTGHASIVPAISVSNNFRLPRLNARVNGVAFSKASSIVNSKIPGEEALIDSETGGEMSKTLAEAKKGLADGLGRANSIFSHYKELPFAAKFSSQGGGQGQLKLVLDEVSGSGPRKAQPKMDESSQAADRGVIHQDFLNKVIGTELAGKRVELANLKDALCGPQTRRFLDFCEKDLPPMTQKMAVVFASENPVQFAFEGGRIRLRLNALYQMQKEVSPPGGPLLSDPKGAPSDNTAFETIPYSVDIVYQLGEGSAKLQTVTVAEHSSAAVQTARAGHDGGARQRDVVRDFLEAGVRKQIQESFRGAMKETLEFPSVSFPTKGFSVNGSAPQITETGTLFPLQTKAANGWLAVSHYYCSESQYPLGVVLQESLHPSGVEGKRLVHVSSVTPDSPADQAGLRAGDLLETYGSGDGSQNLVRDQTSFIEQLGERASQSTAGGRTMVLGVRGADGQARQSRVTLCPSGFNHRERAMETLALAAP